MGGIEATSIIRKYEDSNNLERVPIIALTAHAMLGDREKWWVEPSHGGGGVTRLIFLPAQYQYRYGRIPYKTPQKARSALNDQQGRQFSADDHSACHSRNARLRNGCSCRSHRIMPKSRAMTFKQSYMFSSRVTAASYGRFRTSTIRCTVLSALLVTYFNCNNSSLNGLLSQAVPENSNGRFCQE